MLHSQSADQITNDLKKTNISSSNSKQICSQTTTDNSLPNRTVINNRKGTDAASIGNGIRRKTWTKEAPHPSTAISGRDVRHGLAISSEMRTTTGKTCGGARPKIVNRILPADVSTTKHSIRGGKDLDTHTCTCTCDVHGGVHANENACMCFCHSFFFLFFFIFLHNFIFIILILMLLFGS